MFGGNLPGRVRWIVSLIALLSIGYQAKNTAAQQADSPRHSVGDRWQRSNGQIVSVVAVDEEGVTFSGMFFTECSGCRVKLGHDRSWIGITEENGQEVRATQFRFLPVGPGWKFFVWPLEVGEHWTISAQAYLAGNPYFFDVRSKVESYEEVSVKAGRFWTFRIRREWSYRDVFRTYTLGSEVVWYSPRAKDYVKRSGSADWELTSYTVR
jgi:hypothetical protein